MRVSIYARYSSENQRQESLEDQIASCTRYAREHAYMVLDAHVYTDRARSGASHERDGLKALLAAAERRLFDVVLVDDLSRLARDNTYMLNALAALAYWDVRLVSVADRLDTADEAATIGFQLRGIFNELMLKDLSKRTFRGQLGQKERGFYVGERTYGYRSEPKGEVRIDKRGHPRPEGYGMRIEPSEAAIVRRIFEDFVAGVPAYRIVVRLNQEGVPHPKAGAAGWGPSTVHRILRNEKYIGTWTWNRTGTRRDPRSGRTRTVDKPKSEHVVRKDESLRIVSQEIWDAARARCQQVQEVWPGGKRRGFSDQQGSRSEAYPKHLLDGMLFCHCCHRRVTLVSGTRSGSYGCDGSRRRVCDNRLTVRRRKAERIFFAALTDRLLEPGVVRYALKRVADELKRLAGDVSARVAGKEAELAKARQRLDRLVELVAEGHAADSGAIGRAIAQEETRISTLEPEIAALRRGDDRPFAVPSEARTPAGPGRLGEHERVDLGVGERRRVLPLGPHRDCELVAGCAASTGDPVLGGDCGTMISLEIASWPSRTRAGEIEEPSETGQRRSPSARQARAPSFGVGARRGPRPSCCASRPAGTTVEATASPQRRPSRRSRTDAPRQA